MSEYLLNNNLEVIFIVENLIIQIRYTQQNQCWLISEKSFPHTKIVDLVENSL